MFYERGEGMSCRLQIMSSNLLLQYVPFLPLVHPGIWAQDRKALAERRTMIDEQAKLSLGRIS